MARRASALLLTLMLVPLIGGCGGPGPTATPGGPGVSAVPSTPPVLGVDWGRSTTAPERPEGAFAEPTPGVGLQSQLPGRAGHPEHFPGQAIMSDVASTPAGLVAIGYVYPGWLPISWTSVDGEAWALHAFGTTEDTFPVALAVGADGTIVAVGRTGTKPVAWVSADGVTWTEEAVPVLGVGGSTVAGAGAERMTTVVATPDGFLAGGSVGPELGDRRARFWRSPDGRAWTPVPDESEAFADAEVRSIVRNGSGYAAVGFLGTGETTTGSVAWTSPDGVTWKRIDAPDLLTGRAVSLVVAPSGGLVAVGSDLDIHEALTWTSADGTTWTRSPGEASRQYHGKIRMNDVAVVDGRLIAVGDYNGLQFANMAAWSSTDGIHWDRAIEMPVFGQGEPYAVTAAALPGAAGSDPTAGAVAVGSFGNPDNYIPQVWLTPHR